MRLAQAKLSRKSNQVARGRIRRFRILYAQPDSASQYALARADRAAFLGARNREAVRAVTWERAYCLPDRAIARSTAALTSAAVSLRPRSQR